MNMEKRVIRLESGVDGYDPLPLLIITDEEGEPVIAVIPGRDMNHPGLSLNRQENESGTEFMNRAEKIYKGMYNERN